MVAILWKRGNLGTLPIPTREGAATNTGHPLPEAGHVRALPLPLYSPPCHYRIFATVAPSPPHVFCQSASANERPGLRSHVLRFGWERERAAALRSGARATLLRLQPAF